MVMTPRKKPMSIKNRITANKQNMSDPRTRLSLREDMMVDNMVEEISTLKNESFSGTIISQELTTPDEKGNVFIKAEIRTELNDSKVSPARTNPSGSSEFTDEEIKLLRVNHTYALSRFPVGPIGGDSGDSIPSYVGLAVKVYFVDGAPNSRGKERGAEFELSNEAGSNAGFGPGISGGFKDLFDSESKLVASTANPNEDSKMAAGDDKGAFTCKDIDTAPFRNSKGNRMFARKPETADKRGFDMRGRGTNLLITTFLNALSSMVPFKLLINSTFRTQKRQGELVTGKIFEDPVGWSGISPYGKSSQKLFKKHYFDCKKKRPCVEAKQIAYWQSKKPKGHGLGLSVDINSITSLTAGQVKQVLCAADKLGTSAIFETTPPHIHVTITSPSKMADANNAALVKPFADKWQKTAQLHNSELTASESISSVIGGLFGEDE